MGIRDRKEGEQERLDALSQAGERRRCAVDLLQETQDLLRVSAMSTVDLLL